MTFGVYISHPEVRIDPAMPVPDWSLSETGMMRARQLASRAWILQLGRIVSSAERKAIETAALLAERCGVDVEMYEDMGENDRSATGFLPPSAFEVAASHFFAEPYVRFRGWERAIDAQARIVSAVERVLNEHDIRKPVAFVGHGGVGTLLKCHLGDRAITRKEDQNGGGNLFVFELETRRLQTGWIRMEDWPGV